jgi:hypothetical protein
VLCCTAVLLSCSENVQKLSQDNMPTDPDSMPDEWAEEEVRMGWGCLVVFCVCLGEGAGG